MERALTNSPALDAARSRVAQAEQRIEQARAPGRPQVGLEAGYTYLSPTLNFGPFPLQVNHNYSVGVAARQVLATFGRLHWNEQSARLQAQATRAEVEQRRQDLLLEVRSAYAQVLLAQEAVRIEEGRRAADVGHLGVARTRFEAGNAPRFDVISMEAAIAQSDQRLVSARNDVSVAMSRLATLLGLASTEAIEVVALDLAPLPLEGLARRPSASPTGSAPGRSPQDAPSGAPSPTSPVPGSRSSAPLEMSVPGSSSSAPLETSVPGSSSSAALEMSASGSSSSPALVDAAVARSPRLDVARQALAAARARVEAARAGNRPSIDLQAGYARRNDTAFQTADLFSVGLQLRVPLADGGMTRARVGEAQAVVAELEADLEAARRALLLDVRESALALEVARRRVQAAEQVREKAAEALRVAGVRFKGGVSTPVELVDAQAAFTQADVDVTQARYASRVAEWRWLHEVGLEGVPLEK